MHRFRPSALAVLAGLALLACASTEAQLGAEDRSTLLMRHNNWRARYHMAPLAWDDAVASVAQDWANHLAASNAFAHRQDPKYGENLWWGTAQAFPIASVVDSWGGEVADYDAAANRCHAGKMCGHFTQIIWWNTLKVGCGKATASSRDIVVCNYDPPGNYIGQSPFGPAK